MELKDFFGENREIRDIITDLKRCKEPLRIPPWSELRKQYYTSEHRIKTDQGFWKDRGTSKRPKRVARITYGAQKMYARRMTQYAFTIPVKRLYRYDKDKYIVNDVDTMQEVISALEAIYKAVHINSINSKRWKHFYAACELLTIWYSVKCAPHNKYGFETDRKLRCKSYSPMDGYDLYPIFDDFDDLIGFCIEYKKEEYVSNIKTQVTYFEVFSPDEHIVFKMGTNGSWELHKREDIAIGKLPLAYEFRHEPIWEDQTSNTDEIELALSRESEILRDNSAPLVKVSGQLKKSSDQSVSDSKGKSLAERTLMYENAEMKKELSESDGRRFVKTENGGDVQYVTWNQSVEAMKFFIQELKKNSDEIVQLPNLSMENVKGLGALSGEARQTLVIDAHLKVGEEQGDIILFLEREFAVISAYLAVLNPAFKERLAHLSCEHTVTAFTFKDEEGSINKWSRACGDKALLSRKTAIAKSGLVENPDEEYEAIQKEENESLRRTAIGTLLNEEDDDENGNEGEDGKKNKEDEE